MTPAHVYLILMPLLTTNVFAAAEFDPEGLEDFAAGLDFSPSYNNFGDAPAVLARKVVPWAKIIAIDRMQVEEVLLRVIDSLRQDRSMVATSKGLGPVVRVAHGKPKASASQTGAGFSKFQGEKKAKKKSNKEAEGKTMRPSRIIQGTSIGGAHRELSRDTVDALQAYEKCVADYPACVEIIQEVGGHAATSKCPADGFEAWEREFGEP
eukprot:COSAG05_NODE_851_length_6973_cov_6.213995_5_plen_209_part_00